VYIDGDNGLMLRTGRIRNFNTDRGFGFISEDGGGVNGGRLDVFFHVRTLADVFEPQPGMRVSFDGATDKLGRPQAVNVRLAE
jgi:cold shock CspA family protein